MIIKKFQGKTEKEAILAAQTELGSSAVIMNIKTIRSRGMLKLFRKEVVEVTAALEEKKEAPFVEKKETLPNIEQITTNLRTESVQEGMEQRLDNIQSLLEQQIQKEEEEKSEIPIQKEMEEKEWMPFLRMVYKQLLNNEVEEGCANQIISEVERSIKKEATLDSILAAVYQKIILKLGEPKKIEYDGKQKKIYFFIGPTGVGKTTTIAKLASELKMYHHAKLALMTSDTYRLAAVEQLRIYANILELPLQVIYEPEDLDRNLKLLSDYDTILIDTAGRSHKNEEHCNELKELLQSLPKDCDYQPEVFLVVSVTTKYNDLVNICNKFKDLCQYSVIFTKLDETNGIGNILNIAMLEQASISYETSGQNVPDDIAVIDVQKIAKQLRRGV